MTTLWFTFKFNSDLEDADEIRNRTEQLTPWSDYKYHATNLERHDEIISRVIEILGGASFIIVLEGNLEYCDLEMRRLRRFLRAHCEFSFIKSFKRYTIMFGNDSVITMDKETNLNGKTIREWISEVDDE